MDLTNLNERQIEAVLTIKGPVMVMAGAGSGKTSVLTNRIAYLINDRFVNPRSILAVTFTNKAATEMKNRVADLVDEDVHNMSISTFHSFCRQVLMHHISKLDRYKNFFNISDEEDSISLVKESLKELQYDNEYKPKHVKNLISSFKNNVIDKFNDYKVESIYQLYQNKLVENSLLDFDDLILVTIELFLKFKNVADNYKERFKYILVDEFQDTNKSQYKLIQLMTDKDSNIFVVGDQDQSIYSFRGARIENIDLFLNYYNNTKLILLEENYRSTQAILDISNKLISNNKNRVEKKLFSNIKNTELPIYANLQDQSNETAYIVKKINEIRSSQNLQYNDFAILYRSNYLSRTYEDAFIRNRIPYKIYGGLSFFSRKEIKDIVCYLRVIVNPDDNIAFKRIVNVPARTIGEALISKLTDVAKDNGVSLFSSIDIYLKQKNHSNLITFKFLILELREILLEEGFSIPDIIDLVLDKTGYSNMLLQDGEEGKDRLQNVKELKSALREVEYTYQGNAIEKLREFLSDLALREQEQHSSKNTNSIKLMTYHQAKGL
ncbi:MAG: ATP-dependent helicase, partial [Anaeroplasmataceae bacterium]